MKHIKKQYEYYLSTCPNNGSCQKQYSMKIKIIFILLVLVAISFRVYPQTNLALNQKDVPDQLKNQIGYLADFLFDSKKAYDIAEIMMLSDTFDKKENWKSYANHRNSIFFSDFALNDRTPFPIPSFFYSCEKDIFKIYREIYDTLAYRDIVSHPFPDSENDKWKKVYESYYTKFISYTREYLKLVNIRSFNDSIWNLSSQKQGPIISVARMTGPNQFVFLNIGCGWYSEFTMEFSELTYTITETQPITEVFSYQKLSPKSPYYPDNFENPNKYEYFTSTYSFYYNSYQDVELEVLQTFDNLIPYFRGRFLAPPKKRISRLLSEIFYKDDDDPWTHMYYKRLERREDKRGYAAATGKCFCEGHKYCPMSELIFKYSQLKYYERINKYTPYYLDKSFYVKTYSLSSWADPEAEINGVVLMPVGWQFKYNKYGLLQSKVFYAGIFNRRKTRIIDCQPEGLFTFYHYNDSVCIGKSQSYLRFGHDIDTAFLFLSKTYYGSSLSDSYRIPIDTLYLYFDPVNSIEYRKRFLFPGDTEKTVLSIDSLFIRSKNSAKYIPDGGRDFYPHYRYKIRIRKYERKYRLKHKTIYRIYPWQIDEYIKSKYPR